MKKYYVEFLDNKNEPHWTVCNGDRKEDVEYTLSIYDFTATLIEEIH